MMRACRSIGLALGAALASLGCTGTTARLTAPTESYRAALDATAPGPEAALAPGSAAERAALDGMQALFRDFSTSNVSARVRQVYAPAAYLRDGFKELRGIDAIAPYLIRSTEPLRSCRFEFEAPVRQGGEYYLRWIMVVNLKRDAPERVERVLGMSHVRFDASGRVVFHQDYWDPSDVLYRRIPVAGWLIDRVKARL